MRIPTDLDIERLMHRAGLNEAQIRDNSLRTPQLKVQRASSSDASVRRVGRQNALDPRTMQREKLSSQISKMEDQLGRLDIKIAERVAVEQSENRKAKARKERAAKERDKPRTAAEKAQATREVRQRKLQHAAMQDASLSGGGDIRRVKEPRKASASELQALATKVRGQIAVAKQKLAAL